MNTVYEVKKEISKRLKYNNISFTKITSKTVSFQDLARGDTTFITLHGIQHHEDGVQLKTKLFSDIPKGFIIDYRDYTLTPQ